MRLDKPLDLCPVLFAFEQAEFNHIHIAVEIEISVRVPHISDATAHTCSEVASCLAKHHNPASGHIHVFVLHFQFASSNAHTKEKVNTLS